MKLTTLSLVASCACVLSACGGGNADDPAPPTPLAPAGMAQYIGIWSSPCKDNTVSTLSIAGSGPDTVTMSETTDFFAQPDCSGSPRGTISESAGRTLAYRGVADASVVYSPGTAAVAARVEKITSSRPAIVYSMSGPGVFGRDNNGVPESCADLGRQQSICARTGPDAALPPRDAVMHVIGNKFYGLSGAGPDAYVVDKIYTRR